MPHIHLAQTDIDLYYEDYEGPAPDAPTLVLLHGAGGNHLSWWQQVPTLTRTYRCLALDLRGFGLTRDPANAGWTRHGDDLLALLDALEVDRAALVAQSMGGRAAIEAATRIPDRLAAIVMADTWGFFQWPEQQERQAQVFADRPTGQFGMVGPDFPGREPERTFLYQRVSALNTPADQRPPNAWRDGGPTAEQVAAVRLPVLFLVGADDAICPPHLIQATHRLIPGSGYVEVPGSGHSVYWEEPREFNRLVGAFLAQHLA